MISLRAFSLTWILAACPLGDKEDEPAEEEGIDTATSDTEDTGECAPQEVRGSVTCNSLNWPRPEDCETLWIELNDDLQYGSEAGIVSTTPVESDGTFVIDSVGPGAHMLRVRWEADQCLQGTQAGGDALERIEVCFAPMELNFQPGCVGDEEEL